MSKSVTPAETLRRALRRPARRRHTPPRLDQPYLPSRRLTPTYDPEAFGRMSETIARFLGTGRFLVAQSMVIIAWVAWNAFVPKALKFDPYPFIFLTLVLSLQAAYAAPLILLAQNRQDDRDRANLTQDRADNARVRAETEYLTRELAALRIAVGEVATRDFLRTELRGIVDILENLDGDDRETKKRERKAERKAERRAERQAERQIEHQLEQGDIAPEGA
jgi:uncharacterized membrane protein